MRTSASGGRRDERRTIRIWCITASALLAGWMSAAAPAQEPPAKDADPAATVKPVVYATQIRPIFMSRCGSCHSGDRGKGGLTLDKPETILEGGRTGPALVAGKPEESLLIQRLRLPEDERGHMPPSGKPQLTDSQIKLLEAWVAAGASFEVSAGPTPLEKAARPATRPAVAASRQDAPENAAAKSTPATQPTTPVQTTVAAATPGTVEDNPPPANPTAISALRAHLVYVEAVAKESNRIRLDFAAAAKRTKDAQAVKLIEPVLEQLDGISLARCPVGDSTIALLAKAPRLQRLDARNTQVTDAAMASLAASATLRELVLTQTRLTDASLEHLLVMPALQRVYLWRSGLSTEAVKKLRQQRPKLRVEAGDAPAAEATEVEPPFKLTGDAPPPVVAAAADAPAAPPGTQPAVVVKAATAPTLKPMNDVCPVSGQPVSPDHAVVFKARIIGFCCNKCAAQFLQDPSQYETKVVAAVR